MSIYAAFLDSLFQNSLLVAGNCFNTLGLNESKFSVEE